MIAVAVVARQSRLNQWQQSTGGIAWLDVGIDVLDELVVNRILDLHSVQRFTVRLVAFSANMIGNAGGRHQVAFVSRVDIHHATVSFAGFHRDRDDTCAVFLNALFPIEPLAEDDGDLVLLEHVLENLLGDVGLEVQAASSLRRVRAP